MGGGEGEFLALAAPLLAAGFVGVIRRIEILRVPYEVSRDACAPVFVVAAIGIRMMLGSL